MPEVLSPVASRVQNPDGSYTQSTAVAPVWFQDAGLWKPVDITLSKQSGNDVVFAALPDGTKVTFDALSLSYAQEKPDGTYINTIGPTATFVECVGNVITYVMESGAKFQFLLTRSGVKALTTVATGADVPPTWKMDWAAKLTPVLDKTGGLAYAFKDGSGQTRFRLRQPVIYDESMMNVLRSGDVVVDKQTGDLAVVLSQAGLTKPYLVDPTATFNPGAGDGRVLARGTFGVDSWTDVRNFATGTVAATAGTNYSWGNCVNNYNIGFVDNNRIFMPIDTSALPDNATITASTLSAYWPSVGNDTDLQSLVLIPAAQASTSTLAITDYSLITFTDLGRKSFASIMAAPGAYFDIVLTSFAQINKTGFSLFAVLGSLDFDNTTPTLAQPNNLNIEMSETATPQILSVTYTVPSGDGGASEQRRRNQLRLLGLP